ncbi:hypothetical protein E2C01_081428 [Portunus trituberculatus]|uniref:Uncharacterized protein n=1 Tax=Portunus trituberculatus TaxID=210409 RepID=A0A5B7J2A7_PORTR|nr:hypothetical protein [Portunus trituberculatus]
MDPYTSLATFSPDTPSQPPSSFHSSLYTIPAATPSIPFLSSPLFHSYYAPIIFNASKTIYQLDTTYQTTIPSSSVTLNLFPSSTLNILSLTFTHNLNWKLHISSLGKTASMKLGFLRHLRQLFSPLQLLTLYRCLICPCLECSSTFGGFPFIQL